MPQTISPARKLARWLLVLAASLVFVFAPLDFNDISENIVWWSVMGATTALVINLGLIFTNHKVHAASSLGFVTYLTLGNLAWGNTLLVIGLSSVIGVFLHQLFLAEQSLQDKLREAFQMGGQVILSLTVGMGVYEIFDGSVPLATWERETVFALMAFCFSILATYLLLLRLVTNLKPNSFLWREFISKHMASIAGVVFIPYMIGVGAIYSYNNLSTTVFSEVILVEVFLLIIIYSYNRNLNRSEQQVRELTRLTRLSNSIRTSLDLETLLQTVYLQVSNLLEVDNFSIIVQDQTSQQIQYLMNVRQGRASRVPDGSANELLRYIVEQQQPVLVHEGEAPNASNLGFAVPEQRVKSWLGVPFDASEQTKGVMVVHSDTAERKFGNDDRRRLSVIARQVGVAIDNALMYDLSRTRVQQLRDLNEVGTELSSTLEMSKVLDKIVAAAKKIMNGDGAALFVWTDMKRQNITLARAISMSDGFTMMPSLPLLSQERNDDLIIVHDARQDERVNDIWITLANEGKASWVEVLLQNIDDRLGVLVVYYDEPQIQTEQDIEVLRTFASQSALAIQNAQLYTTKETDLSRRIDQLSLLQRLSQALFLGTMRLNEMYHTVLQRAAEGTGAESGALFLTQEESPYCTSQIGYDSTRQAEKTLDSLVQEVFLTGEMVLIQDTHLEKNTTASEMRCQLAIPILHDIRVIGAILLESPVPNAFGPEDMFFVMQVGTQARIAIENIRLFQNIETTRDRLQAILNSMREAILLVGPQGHIRLANPPVRTILQLEPPQIMNRTLQQLVNIPPLNISEKLGFKKDVLVDRISALGNQMWQPQGEDVDYDLLVNNRHHFVKRFDIPVESAEGMVGWLMVFMDMTEERELAQAREDLSHMIVHDLRGPLTAINMSLKMLETMANRDASKSEDGEPSKLGGAVIKTTDTSRRAVRKMLNMVNSLLDVAKMESGTMDLDQEPLNLHHIAKQVIDELAPIGEELEVKLLNKVSLDTPLVNIDGEKIERTLLNLVDNALKFTPSQGVVSIEATILPTGLLKVFVRDTGPGVPDDYKKTLFERYTQIKQQHEARKGTGLGLTFCKFTVEAHGGEIWVEDNPKGGSIFAFTLPMVNLK